MKDKGSHVLSVKVLPKSLVGESYLVLGAVDVPVRVEKPSQSVRLLCAEDLALEIRGGFGDSSKRDSSVFVVGHDPNQVAQQEGVRFQEREHLGNSSVERQISSEGFLF